MENGDVEKTVLATGNVSLEVSEVGDGEGKELENSGGGDAVDEHYQTTVTAGIDGGDGVDEHDQTTVAAGSGRGEGETKAKRKRGRPRKQLGEARQEYMAAAEFPASLQKRGRGRPRGSGKWQMLGASLGGTCTDITGGSNFTPYIMTIQEGENIVEKIWSFSQSTCESICILSASGSISSAQIFLPARGGILRYEGQFNIVCLNGSHTYDQKRGGKICLLSVQLAYPDGRLCGGAVAGSLIAAGPTQLTIATFKQKPTQQLSANPNNNGRIDSSPVQAENDGEVRVVATAQIVEEVPFSGPNAIQSSSAQPVDWQSLKPSASV